MNIFVAKLNPSTTTRDLQKLFAHYGLVSTVKVISDHITGKSRGYGFVEMPNSYQAREALKELDNTSFQDSIIVVKNSKPDSLQTAASGTGNRNGSTLPIRFESQPEYNRLPTLIIKPQRDNADRRNFGYRGCCHRNIEQF
jgi:RNA recognition motif-containing protein